MSDKALVGVMAGLVVLAVLWQGGFLSLAPVFLDAIEEEVMVDYPGTATTVTKDIVITEEGTYDITLDAQWMGGAKAPSAWVDVNGERFITYSRVGAWDAKCDNCGGGLKYLLVGDVVTVGLSHPIPTSFDTDFDHARSRALLRVNPEGGDVVTFTQGGRSGNWNVNEWCNEGVPIDAQLNGEWLATWGCPTYPQGALQTKSRMGLNVTGTITYEGDGKWALNNFSIAPDGCDAMVDIYHPVTLERSKSSVCNIPLGWLIGAPDDESIIDTEPEPLPVEPEPGWAQRLLQWLLQLIGRG